MRLCKKNIMDTHFLVIVEATNSHPNLDYFKFFRSYHPSPLNLRTSNNAHERLEVSFVQNQTLTYLHSPPEKHFQLFHQCR